jgi:hypothetical protein
MVYKASRVLEAFRFAKMLHGVFQMGLSNTPEALEI